MLRVGLTGGIGSGKSTVAQRLSQLGAVVVDADQLAREAVARGSDGLAAVATRFGDTVLAEDGSLDRAALGALVFADETARRDLEGITHPLIARRTSELVATAPDDAVVVHDVPLLVEKRYGPQYHLVIVVGAAEQTRIDRLVRARGMSAHDARARIAAQVSDDERRAAADVWLDNDGSVAELRAAVDELWRMRLLPFEANVRGGLRASHPERLALVDPDPAWPAAAARLLDRVRLVLADLVVTADHIGSTSVPGLLAKDVVDLQVGVHALDAVDTPAVVKALQDKGFPRGEGAHHDNSKDGTHWPKVFFGSSDPGRCAHLHVREVGSPGWRWALLLRDWMRAVPDAREEYAAQKLALAGAGLSTSDYAEAKEPWFDSVSSRAEAWAAQAGWEPERG